MAKSEVEKWLRRRGYVHFDRHIRIAEIRRRAQNAELVSSHGFLPFIGKSIDELRYNPAVGTVNLKSRPIKYASHIDAHIYAYYAHLLTPLYEDLVRSSAIDESVLAYRKHPGGKCNIHFANDAFEWIKGVKCCTAFTFDVEGFFESLDHHILKCEWQRLVGETELPLDHYKVFRSITKYAWIELADLANSLGFGRNRIEKRLSLIHI